MPAEETSIWLSMLIYFILGALILVAGHWLAKGWTALIKMSPLKGSIRSLCLYYGKVACRVGSWLVIIAIIPWSSFNINEGLVAFFGIVVGLIASRLDNLLAALTGGAQMARINETIEVGGEVLTITSKGLHRVKGRTLDGKHVTVGYAQLSGSTFINWTRCPYARGSIEIHVDDPDHDIDKVYEAIDAVIKPNGEYDPDYSILSNEEEFKEKGMEEKLAFKGYMGQEPNSHGYRVYFFTRHIGEHGGTIHQLQEAILRSCTERGISLGQTGNLSASNFKVQIDK